MWVWPHVYVRVCLGHQIGAADRCHFSDKTERPGQGAAATSETDVRGWEVEKAPSGRDRTFACTLSGLSSSGFLLPGRWMKCCSPCPAGTWETMKVHTASIFKKMGTITPGLPTLDLFYVGQNMSLCVQGTVHRGFVFCTPKPQLINGVISIK